MRITYVYSDRWEEWNCSEFRAFMPARALARAGHEVTLIHIDWWSKQAEMDAFDRTTDIVVLQRNAYGSILSRIMNTVMKHNVPVLLDLDDDYKHMPANMPSYAFWMRGEYIRPDNTKGYMKYIPFKQLEWASKLCSGISSPSKQILEDWRSYTENLYWLPNYVDTKLYTQYRLKKERKPGDMIWVGWGGSASHKISFNETKVVPAIRRILSENKNVGFILAGNSDAIYASLLHNSYRDRLKRVSWQEHSQWAQTLSSFDVGIIPLTDPYDTRRSWLKPLEYGLMGIPWVGSSNQMLWDLISDYGISGVCVSNKPNDWYEAIMNMVENIGDAEKLFEHNIQWAEAQDIYANADKLAATLENVAHELW